MTSERKGYLDNIRWITVVLVVLYHVIYLYNGVQSMGVFGPFHAGQWQDAYLYLVYPWFMALLFIVSGMSSRFYLDSHTHQQFRQNRTAKLLVPSTVGLFVFWWVLGYFNTKIAGAPFYDLEIPGFVIYMILSVSGIGPLWYIQTLWLFSMLLILVRTIEKDRLWNRCSRLTSPLAIGAIIVLGAIFSWLTAQVLNTPVITVYRFGIYGFCFFAGYFVFSHDCIMDSLERIALPLCIAAVVLGIAYTVLYYGQEYAMEPVINNPLACVYLWIMCLAMLSGFKKWGNGSNGFTRWMGTFSWGLYLFHYLCLASCGWYLHLYVSDTPAAVVYLLGITACFAGSWVLDAIIRRIPVLRWAVMGIQS